jgi:hypothetical protein
MPRHGSLRRGAGQGQLEPGRVRGRGKAQGHCATDPPSRIHQENIRPNRRRCRPPIAENGLERATAAFNSEQNNSPQQPADVVYLR